jgi:hypothetical protein
MEKFGPGMEKNGSGMKKFGSGINIPDPQHCREIICYRKCYQKFCTNLVFFLQFSSGKITAARNGGSGGFDGHGSGGGGLWNREQSDESMNSRRGDRGGNFY